MQDILFHMKSLSLSSRKWMLGGICTLILIQAALFQYWVAGKAKVELIDRMFANKIDIVYTWCNGSDPNYLEKRKKFVELEGFKEDEARRYRYHEELKYS